MWMHVTFRSTLYAEGKLVSWRCLWCMCTSTLKTGRQNVCKISCDFFTTALEGLNYLSIAVRPQMIWKGMKTRQMWCEGIYCNLSSKAVYQRCCLPQSRWWQQIVQCDSHGRSMPDSSHNWFVDRHKTGGLERGVIVSCFSGDGTTTSSSGNFPIISSTWLSQQCLCTDTIGSLT